LSPSAQGAGLRLPILLVCGGAGSPIDAGARAGFARLAPHAGMEIIAKAGHLVARDAPSELAALIGDFAQTGIGARP
jgi:pimeloyl-ACP methyl ester carboxylesterase